MKPVVAVSFSPCGYHLMTGGEDNTCHKWDLRKKKSFYVISAHTNSKSQVKFESGEGDRLLLTWCTSQIKFGGAEILSFVKTVSGHRQELVLWIFIQMIVVLQLFRKIDGSISFVIKQKQRIEEPDQAMDIYWLSCLRWVL